MKLGIISDTHDRVDRIGPALDLFRAHKVDRLIHCGDVTGASTVGAFAGWTIDFVYGNCDWQPAQLDEAISAIGGTQHEKFGDLELKGVKIAWTHSDDVSLFRSLENANHYDFLFYGHSHITEQHRTGKTTVVNPGALHRVKVPTVAVLDLATQILAIVPVPR